MEKDTWLARPECQRGTPWAQRAAERAVIWTWGLRQCSCMRDLRERRCRQYGGLQGLGWLLQSTMMFALAVAQAPPKTEYRVGIDVSCTGEELGTTVCIDSHRSPTPGLYVCTNWSGNYPKHTLFWSEVSSEGGSNLMLENCLALLLQIRTEEYLVYPSTDGLVTIRAGPTPKRVTYMT